ncbi:hypothetical protein Tco_0302929 [Tanacetum coccineum]
MSNSSVSKGLQPKFVPKLIQSSQHTQSSQSEPKVQKDYKFEYKKMKAKLALLEATPSTSQASKTFQSKNKGVQVLMALADDGLFVGKNHVRNGEWININIKKINILLSMDEDSDWQNYLKYINIDLKYVEEQRLNLLSKYNKIVFELNKCRDDLLALKQSKFDAVTFQIQNTKLTKLNHALQDQLKEEKKVNEKWLNSSKKTHADTESSKDSGSEPQTPLPPLNILQGGSPSSEVMTLTYQDHSPREKPGLGKRNHTNPETKESLNKIVLGPVIDQDTKPDTPSILTEVIKNDQESKINELTKLVQMLMNEKINSTQMTEEFQPMNQKPESSKLVNSSKQSSKPNVKNTDSSKPDPLQHEMQEREDHMTLDHDMSIASLKSSRKYKVQPYQYASPAKQILKSKPKPFPPCTHCGFNDHHPDDYRNYSEFRGGILAESSQSSRSSTGRHIKEPIWYLDSRCSRSMTGVKNYLHKYIEQPGPKKKSQTAEMIMSFIRMVENQNDVKVKQIITDNETEFRNSDLESFCDEKVIS